MKATPTSTEGSRRWAHSETEFLMREYASLRNEIMWLLRDYRALERNMIVAVAVAWGWLLDNPESPSFAWLLPLLFVALGALRAAGIFKHFGIFHVYLKKVEDAFLQTESCPEGWENFSWGRTGWVARSAIAFWCILLTATAWITIYELYSRW